MASKIGFVSSAENWVELSSEKNWVEICSFLIGYLADAWTSIYGCTKIHSSLWPPLHTHTYIGLVILAPCYRCKLRFRMEADSAFHATFVSTDPVNG